MSCTHFVSSPSSSSKQLPLWQLQQDLRTRALIFVRCFGVILSTITKTSSPLFRAAKKPPSVSSTAHLLPSVYIMGERAKKGMITATA
jgi:Sec-independent protein secretion pathway component TatC